MCHSGSNELHPAWAIAMRVKDDDPADEVWAMFVRRSGNEGYCSGDQHALTDLPGDTYTFRLPWRPGATGVNSTAKTTFSQTQNGASGPGINWAPNQGVLVSFTLPSAQGGNIIYGELHLQWPGGQGPAPIPSTAPSAAARAGVARGAVGRAGGVARGGIATGAVATRVVQDEPETRVASALTKVPAAQRSQFLASVQRTKVALHPQALKAGTVTKIQALPAKPARPRHKQYQSAADPVKRQRNQAAVDAFKKAIAK